MPLDKELTLAEVAEPRAGVASAKALVLSRKVAERLAGEANLAMPVGDDEDDADVVWSPAHPALGELLRRRASTTRVLAFDELLDRARCRRSARCAPTSRATRSRR